MSGAWLRSAPAKVIWPTAGRRRTAPSCWLKITVRSAAATACAGFCRSELETFRAVLGADVERSEHILTGARRCAYRITAR
ncbi:transcriptional regulator domain-containing protein [Rhizobium sp. NXC14]|nr:transcriptional regulator domain-containing protein [Rhizobium sp. NXC14]